MHISHIHLENWRNFTLVEADLQKRVFLVGPNASGKSNLLDVFRFLHDIVGIGGGFQEAVRRRGGVSRIRCLAATRYPDVAIRILANDDNDESRWHYELRFTQDNLQRPMVNRERVERDGQVLLDRPNEEDNADKDRLTQTYLEQVNVNQKFRDLHAFLDSIRYLHIVPQLVREPDRSVGHRNDPFGGDFLEQVARTPLRTQNARLRKIRDALRVAVPQLRELELWRDPRGTPHLRGNYQHWRAKGAWQTEDQFSDGTLRLLGLLWAVLDGAGPLLLEEPEMSLHAEVVEYLPQMFASIQRRSARQLMVSTHSTELLRDSGIGVDEVLLLTPSPEGTSVELAASFDEIVELLDSGLTLAEAIVPRTRPQRAEQLSLFGE